MTTYLVFKQSKDNPRMFERVGAPQKAAKAEQAIKLVVGGTEPGSYRATPESNWTGFEVEVETTRIVRTKPIADPTEQP